MSERQSLLGSSLTMMNAEDRQANKPIQSQVEDHARNDTKVKSNVSPSSTSSKASKPTGPPTRKHNGLTAGPNDEDMEFEGSASYYEGGNLPVHVGTVLGQYKVVHKLAVSGGANVWLCRDTEATEPRYYAVKILPADASDSSAELWIGGFYGTIRGETPDVHLMLPSKYMKLEGPHGWHELVVYPVWGPPMWVLFPLRTNEDGEKLLRKMSQQITHALYILHASNICHGEFQIQNIFAGISGLDGRSEEDNLNDIGWPDIVRITNTQNEKHTEKFAPQYMVRPVDWANMVGGKIDITDDAYITNFSSSFVMNDPPLYLTVDTWTASPEWLIEEEVGSGSDIWGLGCILFEMRTGKHIFQCAGGDTEVLFKQCLLLGKMPEPWWSKTWKWRKDILEDKENDKKEVVPKGSYVNPYNAYGPRSIKQALETIYDDVDPEDGGEIPRPLDKEEVELFGDLLGKIFKWKPADRITAKEAMDHPYFKYKLPSEKVADKKNDIKDENKELDTSKSNNGFDTKKEENQRDNEAKKVTNQTEIKADNTKSTDSNLDEVEKKETKADEAKVVRRADMAEDVIMANDVEKEVTEKQKSSN